MIWVLVLALAALAFLAMAFLLKAPRKGWEVIGAALLLGVAGYATQAHPGLAGSPKVAEQTKSADPAAMVKARQALAGKTIPETDRWMIIGDAMARNGQFGDAAGVLLGAVDADPKNSEAWLALANALTGHAEGNLTPASLHAFQRAAEAEPAHPGPPFFLGLAMAQSGRFGEAHKLWADLLTRTPADAPWRGDLLERMAILDRIIAENRQ